MSKTFYLAAQKSKTYLWCGQGWKPDKFNFYWRKPRGCEQDQLSAFAIAHLNSPIALIEDPAEIETELKWCNDLIDDGWQEVEATVEDGKILFMPIKDDEIKSIFFD